MAVRPPRHPLKHRNPRRPLPRGVGPQAPTPYALTTPASPGAAGSRPAGRARGVSAARQERSDEGPSRTAASHSERPHGDAILGGTRERLLDAAEELFSQKGIQATGLRDITAKASANLAAVNYHFRSKDALVRQVFQRHLAPLNAERIAILDRAERASGGKHLPLETILHALFDPTISLWADHPHFMRILGRLQFEADDDLHAFYLSRFEETIVRFKAALTRALPRVPLRELFWRMHFIFGAMVQTWACGSDLETISEGLCSMRPYQATIDRLVAFGVAALTGQYPGERKPPPGAGKQRPQKTARKQRPAGKHRHPRRQSPAGEHRRRERSRRPGRSSP